MIVMLLYERSLDANQVLHKVITIHNEMVDMWDVIHLSSKAPKFPQSGNVGELAVL